MKAPWTGLYWVHISVGYNNYIINNGNVFNMETSTMKAIWTGLYWVHISVGLMPGTSTNVS